MRPPGRLNKFTEFVYIEYCKGKPTKRKPRRAPAHAALLGLGLDNDDGHKRITTGEQFAIVGGSEETHGRMTETVVKTFEELKHRGKKLQSIEPQELAEILDHDAVNLAAQGWEGTGLRVLAPGETMRLRMQLRIEPAVS